MTFQRENRYIVIKRKDLDAAAAEGAVDSSFAEVLDIVCDNLPARECLVIESDWPEYEPAWRMIQARVEGATLSPAHIEDGEEVEVVERYRAVLGGLKGLAWERLQEFSLRPSVHAEVVELMTVAQHQRIVAALSAPPAAGVPEKVLRMLSELQWHWRDHDDHWHTPMGFYCPECGGEKDQGHQENCDLAALLTTAPTPPASEQQQTVPRHKFEGLVEEVRLKDAEIARLAEQVMNLQAYRDGESGDGVWHWQGDGEDHLESLTCPIVIRAQDLRRLVASEQQRPAVMPERKRAVYGEGDEGRRKEGWNACLDELLRLNPHLAKGEGV